VLTDELRTLVRDGLVERRTEVGITGVQYALTTLGRSLCGPINQLRGWAEKHADQIERAQSRFDETAREQVRSRRLG
jgi:DNA-binding HxlR family transcriptional regulator